jgi:hypothetical protein
LPEFAGATEASAKLVAAYEMALGKQPIPRREEEEESQETEITVPKRGRKRSKKTYTKKCMVCSQHSLGKKANRTNCVSWCFFFSLQES